jgi:hypothetical protein
MSSEGMEDVPLDDDEDPTTDLPDEESWEVVKQD